LPLSAAYARAIIAHGSLFHDCAACGAVHLELEKQCPVERQIMQHGAIVEIPQVGGLHHRYERIAA
jgi:hypothetical protein